MIHPLVENLENIKDQEIESKINDLTNKYFMTANPYLKEQIAVVLNIYTETIQNRRQKNLKEAMDNRDKDLDNLININ